VPPFVAELEGLLEAGTRRVLRLDHEAAGGRASECVRGKHRAFRPPLAHAQIVYGQTLSPRVLPPRTLVRGHSRVGDVALAQTR
jgi:hypothetical protein